MSMLMRPAVGYLLEHGHHRSPIFVRESAIDDWLNPDELEAEAAVQVLRGSLENPELTHTHHRDMAKGWDRRVSANVKKRDEQAKAMEGCGFEAGF